MTYTERLLAGAIKTMRDYCDNAERCLGYADMSDLGKANRVLHEMAWGWANASVGIENAIAHIDREDEIIRPSK